MTTTIQKKTIWKNGHSYVVTIPKAFIENKILFTNKEYTIIIKEEQENAK
jgi:putative transposon-encoded protein